MQYSTTTNIKFKNYYLKLQSIDPVVDIQQESLENP